MPGYIRIGGQCGGRAQPVIFVLSEGLALGRQGSHDEPIRRGRCTWTSFASAGQRRPSRLTPVALAQLLGVPARTLGKWWPKLRACFEETDGRLRHPQLDREREDQAAWRAARAEAGRKGAARRWQSHRSAMAKPPPEHRTTQDETMAEDVPGDGTRTPEPMLGNGIAVRSSQFANVARFARNTHRGGEDSYQAVSQSVRRFLLEEPQLLMQEPPDWVELKEGAKDRCRADGVTWTRSAVIARAIDSELTKFRKGVGEVARKVKGTGQ